jgi:TatD DNase family protein
MKTPPLFDSHVHLDAPPLVDHLPREMDLAGAAGVGNFLIPGVSRRTWPGVLETARAVPGAFAAPGLHPGAAADWNDEAARELATLLDDPLVVAIGEIGLDRLLPEPEIDLQEAALRGQLQLAVAAGLPVLIHCRRASARLLALLREEGAEKVGGIFHAFSGSPETAREAIALGFAIAFGGALTFPGSRRAAAVLRAIPPEWVVLETDAPDLAPHPHRGTSNRPAYLQLVARCVGEIRNWSEAETARITSANTRRVLRLEKTAAAGDPPSRNRGI